MSALAIMRSLGMGTHDMPWFLRSCSPRLQNHEATTQSRKAAPRQTSVLPVIRPEYAEQFLTFRQRTSRPSGHDVVIASPQRLHRGWDLILVMTV
jgi:hypothetical protein